MLLLSAPVTRKPLALGIFVAAVLPIHFRAGHGIAVRAPQDRVGLLGQIETAGPHDALPSSVVPTPCCAFTVGSF
jgi:hypothetical protein